MGGFSYPVFLFALFLETCVPAIERFPHSRYLPPILHPQKECIIIIMHPITIMPQTCDLLFLENLYKKEKTRKTLR